MTHPRYDQHPGPRTGKTFGLLAPASLRDTVDALNVALESTTASFKRFNEASKRRALPMVGDIVRPREALRYWPQSMFGPETAVVVRVSPFVVFEQEEQRGWSSHPRESFEVIGRADDETFAECQDELTGGRTNRLVKRERAKVRRRNRRAAAEASSIEGDPTWDAKTRRAFEKALAFGAPS